MRDIPRARASPTPERRTARRHPLQGYLTVYPLPEVSTSLTLIPATEPEGSANVRRRSRPITYVTLPAARGLWPAPDLPGVACDP